MAGGGSNHHHELLAVADAAMVFPPVHFSGIGGEVRAGDMVIGAELSAAEAAAQGHGERGRLSWIPVSAVVDVLDEAFHGAFAHVVPTGVRLLVGVDVSGSMHGSACAGSPVLTATEAAAAMAMTFVRTEGQVEVVAFDTALHAAPLSPRQRLDDVVRLLKQWQGGTDVALPVRYALDRRREVDAVVVITDSETWAGRQHPVQALREYRERINPAVKAVVLATTSTAGSVIPEDEPNSLGSAGFDAAVPQVVADFVTCAHFRHYDRRK